MKQSSKSLLRLLWRIGAACALLFGLAGSLTAQTLTPSADELLQLGAQVVRMADKNQVDGLWELVAPFVKTKVTKEEFIEQFRSSKKLLGIVSEREWVQISRSSRGADSDFPPEGQYANVVYMSRAAEGKAFLEVVSMRREGFGWRVTGYVPQEMK